MTSYTHPGRDIVSPKPPSPTPSILFAGAFDDLDSLAGGGISPTFSHKGRGGSIDPQWPLDLQPTTTTTPKRATRAEGGGSDGGDSIGSLGRALDRIGGDNYDDDEGGGIATPDLLGGSSSLGSMGVASLYLGTPESQPLLLMERRSSIASSAGSLLDKVEAVHHHALPTTTTTILRNHSLVNHANEDSSSKSEIRSQTHLYHEDTVAGPTTTNNNKPQRNGASFRAGRRRTSNAPDASEAKEIFGSLEAEAPPTLLGAPPPSLNIRPPTTDRHIAVLSGASKSTTTTAHPPPSSPPSSSSPSKTSAAGSAGKRGGGRGGIKPLSTSKCTSPAPYSPPSPATIIANSTSILFMGSPTNTTTLSPTNARVQLSKEYEQVMPLELSLLKDSYALGSFNLLTSNSRAGSSGPFTKEGSLGSFTLDSSTLRRHSVGQGPPSSTSRNGYVRYGNTVASVSALEKHTPMGDSSVLDFSLSSMPRRARSAEGAATSSRANSFALSDSSTPVLRPHRVSVPSSEQHALIQEIIRQRSMEGGVGGSDTPTTSMTSEDIAIQLLAHMKASSPDRKHSHPLGREGGVLSPPPIAPYFTPATFSAYSPPPPSPPLPSAFASSPTNVYDDKNTIREDVIRTTRRRRYKPDVIPVSLIPLCHDMEYGKIDRPEMVWYAGEGATTTSDEEGTRGGRRVVHYPITTPPLTPQQLAQRKGGGALKEWSLDEQHTPTAAKDRGANLSPSPNSNCSSNAPSPVEYCIFQGKKMPARERDRRIEEETQRKRRLRDAASAYLNTAKPRGSNLAHLSNAPKMAPPKPEPPLRPTFLPLPEQKRPGRGLSPIQLRTRPSSCN